MSSTKTTIISKLIDSIPTLLIVLGVLLALLGISKGITYNGWLPIPDLPSRVISGLFGMALISAGLFLAISPRTPTLRPGEYGVKIQFPAPGESVLLTDVRGTLKKALPDGHTLKIFRVYQNEAFFPLRDCRVDHERGIWEATGCDLGFSAKKGEKRAFTVNLVGPAGTVLIDYLRRAAEVHNPVRDELQKMSGRTDVSFLPLLQSRTHDMIECDRVDVRRS